MANEKPEDFIPRLLDPAANNVVLYQEEITSEELDIEKALRANLTKFSKDSSAPVKMESVWGLTLHHKDDLDYDPNEYLPHIYGRFRDRNALVKVRPELPSPAKGELPYTSSPNAVAKNAKDYLPTLSDFGFSKAEIEKPVDKRSCYPFVGSEEAGLKRMNEFIHEKASVAHYNDTRNNLLGSEYSSKLSPWLANGALSVRTVYHATKKFEKEQRANESTKVFIDELFWRDFNKFWFMKYKNKAFSAYGVYDRSYYNWTTDKEIVQRW